MPPARTSKDPHRRDGCPASNLTSVAMTVCILIDGAPRWRGRARPYFTLCPAGHVPGFNFCLNPSVGTEHNTPLLTFCLGSCSYFVKLFNDVVSRFRLMVLLVRGRFVLRWHLPLVLCRFLLQVSRTGLPAWSGLSRVLRLRLVHLLRLTVYLSWAVGLTLTAAVDTWSISSSKSWCPFENFGFAVSLHTVCTCSFSVSFS